MNVKLDELIKNLAGESIIIDDTEKKDSKGNIIEGTGDLMTLKFLCTRALTNTYASENNLSGQEKFERGVFAMEIQLANGSMELKSEQIALLKKLIGMAYSPLAIAQAWNILENKDA